MRKSEIKNSNLKIILIFILFFVTPIILGTIFNYTSIFGYISPLALLFFTWWLYTRENKNLSALGFTIGKLIFLALGILLGVLFFSMLLGIEIAYNQLQVHINEKANFKLILMGFFFLLQGVLNEEFIFRGFCFIKLKKEIGLWKANLVMGFLFIVWHWVAYSAWGNYGLMASLMITGLGHLMFATSLLKSGTLFLPIGIHLGNNWAQRYLFSTNMGGINTTPTNDVLFIVTSNENNITVASTSINYIITIGMFLVFTLIIWKWKVSKEDKTPSTDSLL